MRPHRTCVLILIIAAVCAGFSAQAQITARINTDRVSVRAKASIFSEVVGQLRQGDQVTVLEVIKQQQPRQGEPTEWVKIKMPTNVLLWVNAAHVDSSRRTVVATRLNVRAGPGLNYSIVGSLNKGDSIRAVRALDDWVEIEAPPDCWAFVNGLYLTWGKPERDQASKTSVGVPGSAARDVTETKSAEPQVSPVARAASAPSQAVTRAPSDEARSNAVARPLPSQRSLAEAKPAVVETNREPPSTKGAQVGAAVSGGPSDGGDTGEVRRGESMAGNVVQRIDVDLKRRSVRREGILVRSMAQRVPSPYRLRSVDTGRIVGFVRFSSEVGDVRGYVGRRVVIEGVESPDQSSPTVPVIFATGIALVEQ